MWTFSPLRYLLFLAISAAAAFSACAPTPCVQACATCERRETSDAYVRWLEARSMLHHADLVALQYSGVGTMWQHPYAIPQPHAAAATASVWFTAYAPSTMTRPNESVLEALGDAELWRLFHEIGIDGIHTGPTKRAGAIRGREYTPTIDGYFDRIENSIDPAFGTENDYRRMVENARARGAIVIGDLIPGHSGKGADFRLAERRYRDYPGLYHMVEIRDADLPLLCHRHLRCPGHKHSEMSGA